MKVTDFSKGEMLVITGLLAMVEEEGKTPREAIIKADELSKMVFHALLEIEEEVKR